MGLYFQNNTGEYISLAYGYYSPDCGDDPWAKKGWYAIAPGQERQVWSGWASQEIFYFYAHSSTRRWGGDFFGAVPPRAFNWCWDTASSDSEDVGFGQIGPISWGVLDHTVNLG